MLIIKVSRFSYFYVDSLVEVFAGSWNVESLKVECS